jgi:hypothetical protein
MNEQRGDSALLDYCYQISDELLLAATRWEEVTAAECLNHSCNPNAGFHGEIRLVALREITVGEEVTFDYATCMTASFGDFDCLCGAANCRGRITGEDWKLPELQTRLRGYFQPYIEAKIESLQNESTP